MSNQKIVKFATDRLLKDAEAPAPTPRPIGNPVSMIQARSIAVDNGRAGIWTSSPGRWHRQVVEPEYCIFLEGQCIFTPENGDPITISAGDVLYFPANSCGVWDIVTECRKAYFIFA